MSKRGRITTVVMSVLVSVAAVTSPVAAMDVVTFSGTATVCSDLESAKPTAHGCPDWKAQGLYVPLQPGGDNSFFGLRFGLTDTHKWTDRWGNWEISTGGAPIPTPDCSKHNLFAEAGLVGCELDLVGELGPVASGIGAACGMSQGFGGNGLLSSENDSEITIFDLGWPATAGGTLPVTGSYYVTADKEKAAELEKPESGRITGTVFVQGGAACLKTPIFGKAGASQFNVTGTLNFGP